jgi:DNA polymerase IIIc chi subunit
LIEALGEKRFFHRLKEPLIIARKKIMSWSNDKVLVDLDESISKSQKAYDVTIIQIIMQNLAKLKDSYKFFAGEVFRVGIIG